MYLIKHIIYIVILILKISDTSQSCKRKNDRCYFDGYQIQNVTEAGGIDLESPNWSILENALYWVDNYGNKLFRMDGKTGEITTREVCFGPSTLIVPVRDHPGYVVVAIRTSLYLLKWGAPGGNNALRPLTTVDLGRPDNNIDDGKPDAKGRLWFGTFGKLDLKSPRLVNLDGGTLYSIDNHNYYKPLIMKRPVSLSNGIVWSLNNKKMYYNDSPTRRVAAFDYNLEKGEISNETVLFDFNKYNIPGIPDGLTIDEKGRLWVATFNGRKILVVNSTSGELLDQITLPVDQVSSMMWGGSGLSTLYVTTGTLNVAKPMKLSGALFTITGLKTRGVPENHFYFPNAPYY